MFRRVRWVSGASALNGEVEPGEQSKYAEMSACKVPGTLRSSPICFLWVVTPCVSVVFRNTRKSADFTPLVVS